MKEIGGFFDFELCRKREYHPQAIKLNSGRNALRFLLNNDRPDLLHIPYYICNSLVESIRKENIRIKYYHINNLFEPKLSEPFNQANSLILYINYFGINDSLVQRLSHCYEKLIIDNSQAFFSTPIEGVSTFYSPRKFFGVADGGYLYTNKVSGKMELLKDVSYNRYKYLLKRSDIDAQTSYEMYLKNEDSFSRRPVRLMSNLTTGILSSIDYRRAKMIREKNFSALHRRLMAINELNISSELNGPMIYPLLLQKDGLRDFLVRNKIYVATYWREVLKKVRTNTVEYKFAKYLVPLPIDQRYSLTDMSRVAEKVLDFVAGEKK